MRAPNRLVLLALVLTAGACIPHIYRPPANCDDKLDDPHQRAECRVCVDRPIGQEYYYDVKRPSGARCVRR
jgi:hypothetical protein